MHHQKNIRRFLVIVALITLVVGLMPAGGQVTRVTAQENLLQNPGFEPPFNAIGGVSTTQVAVGWQPWHVPGTPGSSSSENLEPDYQPAREERIRTGSGAQEYNTFFATHEGGVFQRVPVVSGSEVEFSVFAYLYSSLDFDDPDNSTNPQGLRVSVGIDPAGGTDGTSSDIVWSAPQEYYDEYQQQSITATATANSVTVWVRSTVDNPAGLHQVFLDDAALVVLTPGEGTLEPTEETPTPETGTPLPTTPPATTDTPGPGETETSTPSPVTTVPPATPVRTPVSEEFPNEVVHVVQSGDTVISLAERYGSTVNAIVEYNGLVNSGTIFVNQTLLIPVPAGQGRPIVRTTTTPVPTEEFGTGGVEVTDGVYVVQTGDNLFRIALRYNTTVDTLARFNGILNPAQIVVGQQIRIPTSTGSITGTPVPAQPITTDPPAVPLAGGVIHVVQPGENIFRIGLRYNMTWDVIAQANGLVNPNLIFVGQELIIP